MLDQKPLPFPGFTTVSLQLTNEDAENVDRTARNLNVTPDTLLRSLVILGLEDFRRRQLARLQNA